MKVVLESLLFLNKEIHDLFCICNNYRQISYFVRINLIGVWYW